MIHKLLIRMSMLCISTMVHAQIESTETRINASKELDEVRSLLISEASMDSVVDKVLNSSYSLRMAEAEHASLKEEVRIESKSWMKSFTIGFNLFGYNVTPADPELEGVGSTTQVSVLSNAAMTLLISPYDIIGQKNRVKSARHRAHMQEMSLFDKRRQVEIYIINKFLDYQAALESYIISENNLIIAEEYKHVSEESFKRGAITNETYNQALSGLMQSRLNLLKVENQVMKLKYEIEILMVE